MSLQAAAQHLASRGRGPDTTLVHMAPQEVAGLQALAKAAGGTLTVNPDTGLPEAGFLKNLLPTLIGAGLMFATGGTAAPLIAGMSNAATIGLGVGGLEALRTGSLEKGLMAGLGAYGGAGFTGGLMGAAAAQSAAPAASMAPTTTSPVTTALTEAGIKGSTPPAASMAVPAAAASTASTAPGMLKYGLAALSPAMVEQPQAPYVAGKPNYEYTYDARTGQYTRVPVGTRDSMTTPPMFPSPIQTVTTMAAGGPISEMSDRNEALTLMANGGQMYAAGGGVSHLGDYSDGGRLLRGPGDGVSDSIPATIANKRPARLADGEFVVPARIVSELGNGSTDAGARKLYAMMDRIQKSRGKTVGKGKVAVNSRADKALPA